MKSRHLVLFALLATLALAWERYSPAESYEGVVTSEPVTIYTTQSCPYCARAMAFMDEIGQPYANRDVQRDAQARTEYMSLTPGNPGVPVIRVGDRFMQGWSRKQLAALLSAGAHE